MPTCRDCRNTTTEKEPECPRCRYPQEFCDDCGKYGRSVCLDADPQPGWVRAPGLLHPFPAGRIPFNYRPEHEGIKRLCEECMIVAQRGRCVGCSKATSHKCEMVAGHPEGRNTVEWRMLLDKFRMDRDNYYVQHYPLYSLRTVFVCKVCEARLRSCDNCHLTAVIRRAMGRPDVHWCYSCLQKRHSGLCEACGYECVDLVPDSKYCKICAEQYKKCEGCDKTTLLKEGFCAPCRQVGNHEARAEEEFQFMMPACHVGCTNSKKHKDICSFDGQYVGVELEVECGNRDRGIVCAQVRKALARTMLIKHDGSLANGLEIVSPPAYLGWHLENWRPLFDWNDAKKMLRSHDTGTCGLHVHINREVLTEKQIFNAVTFLHNPENREFVEMIAGRPSNHYYDFTAPKGAFSENYEVERDTHNRYTALNLCNRRTIEYRLFRGTMKWDTFTARLEFAKFLTMFAGAFDDCAQMNSTEFLKWVERRDDCPALQKYLARGQLIKERK